MLSNYKLGKWSRIVRIRDNHVCWLCEGGPHEDPTSSNYRARREMHAHHIDMKSLYPDKAYHLDNGICLCQDCHLRVIHTDNPRSPRKMRPLLLRHVRYAANRDFNKKWQYKLD